jgi:hypothetical protein
MLTVKIEGKKIWVDQTPIPLLSGEVHYWRLDPASWRPVLERVKEMGLGVVATYACWDFHELEPGRFDFQGQTDPRRNLVGYLDLLSEMGFWIILRPGPYIYSEWHNGGVPDRAAQHHRLSLEFQKMAEPYMKAVVEATRPYFATRGGRVILWQADNEIDPWPHWYTRQLGLEGGQGPFQQFLHVLYMNLDALNQAWDAGYNSFDQAQAVTVMVPSEPRLMRRYLDFTRFQHWYVNQVASWAAMTYRRLGVDLPVYFNAYSGVGTQRWADLEEIGDLAGPDIYPSREFDLRPNEHRTFLEAVRYARAASRLPHIPEFEAGIWHEWLPEAGILPPNHYRLMGFSALLAGAAGWNWYMLANRDNWTQSPINEWGRTRPELFDAFRQVTSIFNEIDPPSLEKITNTALTFDPLQRATQRPGQELLSAAYQSGLDYEFFDLSRQGKVQDEPAGRKPVLFYAGGAWLSQEGQRRLHDYVQAGGHLVLVGAYPYLDDRLLPFNLLEIAPPDGIVSGLPTLNLDVFGTRISSPWMFSYQETPGEAIAARRLSPAPLASQENSLQASLQDGQETFIGYAKSIGKGRLTLVGLQPSPDLILALHKYAGVPIPCRSYTPGISTSLFQRDGDLYLAGANPGQETKHIQVRLDPSAWSPSPPPERCLVQDLVTRQTWQAILGGSPELGLFLPRKDASIWRLKKVK